MEMFPSFSLEMRERKERGRMFTPYLLTRVSYNAGSLNRVEICVKKGREGGTIVRSVHYLLMRYRVTLSR